MITYHNDPAIKTRLLAELAEDEAADRFIRGTYGEGDGDSFRGCSVGCQMRRYPEAVTAAGGMHEAFPAVLGWPEWLARLEDFLFENVEPSRASRLSREIADAMPVGVTEAETDKLRHRFLAWVLRNGLVYDREKDPGVADVVEKIAVMHEDAASGKRSARSAAESAAWSAAWSAAESAAESAAGSTARSAARSAAWSAAESAAESAAWSTAWSAAESAAWSAARSAARSAAESAARSAATDKMADALIVMLIDLKT